MPPIHPLSPELVRLIAAGEIIDSLVAVVRELVDNSLDAGAKRIAVCIWPQRWTLQVSDDGRGMPPEDALVCALPHQTSKIRSVEDLWHVNTLGFRGEGLHALATVGELILVTHSPEQSLASWQSYDHQGQVIEQKPQGAGLGTIVTLSNIFGQMPVRRRFLNLQKEVMAILQWIKYRALAHPHITWQVSIGENDSALKPKLSLWPGNKAKDILLQLFPRLEPSDFAEGSTHTTPKQKITVTVGLPNRYSRPRPDWIIFTINGRCVEDQALLEGVIQLFRRALPKGRYPLCVVNLELPAERVNWNVHPAKTTVQYQDQPALIQQIQETLAQVLMDNLPSTDSRLFRAVMKRVLKEEGISYHTGQKLKAIAQIRNTYILVEHPEGLWLIEQHVAEERVLFELIQREWKLAALPNVVLVTDLTQRQQENLETLGIVLEPFGENIWAIRQAPICLLERSDCAEALRELSRCSDLDSACASLACRTAIRNGTPLDLSFLQNLLDRWINTQNPHTCPHGRPIYLPLAENDLARFFRRNWTLCDNSPQALRKRAGLSDSLDSLAP
ncbi:MAG: DNA mismatch repair endonuclease MutL [Gloeobacterales cyanobacterium]